MLFMVLNGFSCDFAILLILGGCHEVGTIGSLVGWVVQQN